MRVPRAERGPLVRDVTLNGRVIGTINRHTEVYLTGYDEHGDRVGGEHIRADEPTAADALERWLKMLAGSRKDETANLPAYTVAAWQSRQVFLGERSLQYAAVHFAAKNRDAPGTWPGLEIRPATGNERRAAAEHGMAMDWGLMLDADAGEAEAAEMEARA